MNAGVDAQKLVRLFADAPACNPIEAVPFCGELNDYLFEHYLAPFLYSDEPPTIGGMDFSAFTLEDVEALEEYLQKAGTLSEKLIKLHDILNAARPMAGVRRAFC